MSNENPFASPTPGAPVDNGGTSDISQPQQYNPVGQSFPTAPVQPGTSTPTMMTGVQKTTNGLAVSSLVLGITSILIPYLGILLGLIGGILGGISISKITKNPGYPGKTMSIVGTVLSVIGFILWVAITAFMVWTILQFAQAVSDPSSISDPEIAKQIEQWKESQQ
ncbi:DUF4190 domain-containing protein [Mobiluncus mulieris]|uniref:DUF4190 domain-containing protein n=1 Tax=Mobiluncus mulieris TaxID=2052 RepID=A0A7Y0Y3F5_9ACTO|nr:DUF4190 domain-containing protein [Mobiluncus mulieris]NMW64338.1 DUF4190 domain-containing protein [Mobiluncus mulieris]